MEKRTEELEIFFKQFPDVPREVIVKEDVLRLGLRFSKAAVEAAKGAPVSRGTLFTMAKVKYSELAEGEAVATPDEIQCRGGPYNLHRIVVQNRLSAGSPYLVDVIDGQVILCGDGMPIAEVSFPIAPAYYSKRFDDGTPYSEVLPLRGGNSLAYNTAFRVCQFWGAKAECKFCDINENVRQRQKLLPYSRGKAYKSVEQVAEVAKEVFLREKAPIGQRPTSIFITGGTITDKVAGMSEDGFYLQYVERIRDRIGHRWPILLQTVAKDKDTCKRYRDAGVDAHGANIEVWDKGLFKWVCPGKDLYIGRDEWIRRVLESVDVFGEGNVVPNFVLGVEMSQPYGFKDVTSALKSTTEGLEYLMSHGVVPRFDSWNVSPFSALAGNKPPPLEFFIRVLQTWCDIWNKYDLPPMNGMGSMGPGRARSPVSAVWDMDPVKCVCGEAGKGCQNH